LNVIAGLFFFWKGATVFGSLVVVIISSFSRKRRSEPMDGDGWRETAATSSLSLHAHFRLGSFRYAALIGIDVRISTVVVVLVALPPHSAKFTN
jgi:hypothetical protein